MQLASNRQVKKSIERIHIYRYDFDQVHSPLIWIAFPLQVSYQSNKQTKYLNFFVKWLYMYYSAYVLACFQTLESDGDNAHWFPSLENWHFKWFFSRVKVKTMAFSRKIQGQSRVHETFDRHIILERTNTRLTLKRTFRCGS